jgi:hypothetical protein
LIEPLLRPIVLFDRKKDFLLMNWSLRPRHCLRTRVWR